MSKRLFEAIVQAGSAPADLAAAEYQESLPIVILTCIDSRLTTLIPELLRVPEEQLIWLRIPGNIVSDPLGAAARSLALATAIKGGKEIAIIGHTDCLTGKTNVLALTDRFKALGIERSRLPDNLVEFFGLFASEGQNVRRAVDLLASSPLISPKLPLHGLLLNLESRRWDWIVNGYDALPTRGQAYPAPGLTQAQPAQPAPEKVQEIPQPIPQPKTAPAEPASARGPAQELLNALARRLEKTALFKIVGSDGKVYGPVTGEKLIAWLLDERIDPKSLAQRVGENTWKALTDYIKAEAPPPIPPLLSAVEALWKKRR